jgi:amidase
MIFAAATDQLAALAAGQLSSVELLDAYARQIARHEWVNAVVTSDFERAREKAAAADRARAEGRSLGPLHGLPITIKDDVEVAGMRSTYGAPATRDHIPDRDAEAVGRLRAAGAIVFGRTNLPEYAADGQSYNEVHGTTSNPWDASRTPGGSSGGSAAALAAGMTSLELGSDMGGSIRLPASWCGVYGLKPTWGVVPTAGAVPVPGTPKGAELHADDIAVAGPLARDPRDLDLALDILTDPGTADRGWRPVLPPARFVSHRELRAAVWFDDPSLSPDRATGEVLEQAVAALTADGVTISSLSPPLTLERFEQLFETFFMADLAIGLDDDAYQGISAHLQSQTGTAPLAELHLRALRLSHRDWLVLERERLRVRAAWDEIFASVDVVLCPAAVTTAIAHDHSQPIELRTFELDGVAQPHRPALTRWFAPASLCYLPATVAPAGLSVDGLPVGIQILSAQFRDRDTIAAAGLLAQTLGGFRPPPLSHQDTKEEHAAVN